MSTHLIDGEFQFDKYPGCPRGKVPLSARDKAAQDLLWQYAQRWRAVAPEFSDDLEFCLRASGYVPIPSHYLTGQPDGTVCDATEHFADTGKMVGLGSPPDSQKENGE